MSDSTLENHEFSGIPLLEALKENGFAVDVQDTGGGIACFYISQNETEEEICAGPGRFTNHGVVFTRREFYISEDERTRSTGDYDKGSTFQANVNLNATVDQMVNAVIDLHRAMNSQ